MARNSALFDVNVVERTIKNGMIAAVDWNAQTLSGISQTWKHQPRWKTSVRMDGPDLVGEVVTTDEPFFYLNEGTTVRYMHLSRDWRSKTSPRNFKSGYGAGRTIGVQKKFPRKGIEAREWTDMQKVRADVFLRKQVDAAMDYIAQYNMKATRPFVVASKTNVNLK